MPTTRLFLLRDGRYACGLECGDPAGQPVIYGHGGPGSRISGIVFDDVAKRHGIRLISLDRPGMGFSDPKPGRLIGDWAQDVSDVADELGLEEFSIFGASGGGPYALACARFLADRLKTVAVGCSPGPATDDPRMLESFNGFVQKVQRLGRHSGLVFRIAAKLMTQQPKQSKDGKNKENAFTAKAAKGRPASDLEAMRWLEAQAATLPLLATDGSEITRQGLRWAAEDLRAVFSKPWGFRLEDIPMKVHLWHGEADSAVPVDNAKLIAKAIPDAELSLHPGGHYAVFSCIDDIFAVLSGTKL